MVKTRHAGFRRATTLAFLLALAAGSLSAAEEAVGIASARTSALGGAHVGLTDDLSVLFGNPAGFRTADPQFSLAGLTVGLSGPIFDIASVAVEGSAGGDVTQLLLSANVQKLLRNLYAGLQVPGPIGFAYVGNGLGFGLFNQTGLSFSTVGTVPTLTASADEELLAVGGYAFRIPLPADWPWTLDVGASLKAFVRAQVGLSSSLLELAGLFSSVSLDLLTQQRLDVTMGLGLDAGVLFRWKDWFSLGLVGRNLYSPTQTTGYATLQSFLDSAAASGTASPGTVPIDLSAGVMFSPSLGELERVVGGLKLMVDYSDILDFVPGIGHPETASNPILHVGLGAEAVLLDVLAVRGGFHQGLFSAGLGLDLSFFRLDVSMFGREMSLEPGLHPVYNLQVSLDFRLAPGKGD